MGWASYLAPVIAGTSQDGVFANELESSFCSTDPVAARLFAKATFFSDNRGDLPKVNSPCLVLQHAQDSLAPLGVGDYVHQQLAGSTLKVLDVAGHCAHMSHPLLVIDAMQDYFSRPLAG
jgi:sigma-B regulation protein RsbQ